MAAPSSSSSSGKFKLQTPSCSILDPLFSFVRNKKAPIKRLGTTRFNLFFKNLNFSPISGILRLWEKGVPGPFWERFDLAHASVSNSWELKKTIPHFSAHFVASSRSSSSAALRLDLTSKNEIYWLSTVKIMAVRLSPQRGCSSFRQRRVASNFQEREKKKTVQNTIVCKFMRALLESGSLVWTQNRDYCFFSCSGRATAPVVPADAGGATRLQASVIIQLWKLW